LAGWRRRRDDRRLIGFGVDDGLGVAAVLSYRVFAYWLPILPGALAYLRLRHTVKGWEPGARERLASRTPDRAQRH
jgi:hypothetical protein